MPLIRDLQAFGQDWSDNPAEMPTSRKFMIFWVMATGLFMALFDIQIVAASLNDVQAGLAAGPDEISWVQTSYLMAEIVMIPLSGYLTRAISTRWLFTCSAGLFTLSSLLCGLSWNIESMVAFRALQGFTGGAMVPLAFATGFTIFTGKQLTLIPAILGGVGVIAPTLGPTAGGLVTQALDWRWLFFINILPGTVVTILAAAIIRVDRADVAMLKRIDWSHFAAMAIMLGGLQFVLEEGPRKDWFGDSGVRLAGWFALVAAMLFFHRSAFSANPIVRLSPFRRPIFAFSCIFSFVIGFGSYSSIYLMPVYLGRVRGYDSLQIGTTVFVVGLAQILGTMVAARLSQKIDPRLMIAAGILLFATSLRMTSEMTSQWGFWDLALPQGLRGLSMLLCLVPAMNMALGGVTPEELPFASGLVNLLRNLGGAVGIAVVNTQLQDHARIATLRLGEAMGGNPAASTDAILQLTARMRAFTTDPLEAVMLAQGYFGRIVGREALTIAFDDVFRLMSWVFLIALLLVPFCRPPRNASRPPANAAAH
ncbi:MFS transporter [Sphingobium sp. 22B]|uniref:DHA2 family efflux MFS transporter permease subunit n=1 Tax=unclassified Sphingobium TaxID=2611147 RepID=UPI0007846C56|nr:MULTISPECIES: DHA2 family efflux MFS transporter permease subunit [unclassified Sphingobium]KXU32687.1 MFS transporter [Sphingobium sp. AM]KYC32764.1 MFS transporter [Sphingobium sp. 22B]OAP31655.1 MFS transporter [Sphingobium sp. 20006FA]